MSNKDKKIRKTQLTSDAELSQLEDGVSPGRQLKNARESQGLSQKQVADKLRLRVPSIQALEEDLLEPGVSVTFSKGYVRLYAKLVRLEVDPLLLAYDKVHFSDNQPAKLHSFSRRVAREADDHKGNMVTVVVVLMVIGSIIGWWVQQSDSLSTSQSFVSDTFDGLFSESEQAKKEANSDEIVNSADEKNENAAGLRAANQDIERLNTGPEIPEEDVLDTVSNVVSVNDDVENERDDLASAMQASQTQPIEDNNIEQESTATFDTVPALTLQVDEPIVEIAENTANPSSSSVDIKNAVLNEDNTVNLIFTFEEACWVSVKDRNDDVIAIGVKSQGRVMEVSGLPPIQVILCSPENAQLSFGGQQVDLSIYPNDRPAKFGLTLSNNNVFRISN